MHIHCKYLEFALEIGRQECEKSSRRLPVVLLGRLAENTACGSTLTSITCRPRGAAAGSNGTISTSSTELLTGVGLFTLQVTAVCPSTRWRWTRSWPDLRKRGNSVSGLFFQAGDTVDNAGNNLFCEFGSLWFAFVSQTTRCFEVFML